MITGYPPPPVQRTWNEKKHWSLGDVRTRTRSEARTNGASATPRDFVARMTQSRPSAPFTRRFVKYIASGPCDHPSAEARCGVYEGMLRCCNRAQSVETARDCSCRWMLKDCGARMKSTIFQIPPDGVKIEFHLSAGTKSGQVVVVVPDGVRIGPPTYRQMPSQPPTVTSTATPHEWHSLNEFPPRELTE